MRIIKVAFDNQQYTSNLKSHILSLIDSAQLNLNGGSYVANSLTPLVESIGSLNKILESNPDTRFDVMKSHGDQLLAFINILNQKFVGRSATPVDIQNVLTSLENYERDMTSGVLV
jgi:hypothetical protein